MQQEETRKCKSCGKIFVPKTKEHVYCSPECYALIFHPEKHKKQAEPYDAKRAKESQEKVIQMSNEASKDGFSYGGRLYEEYKKSNEYK